ncbi:transposase [Orientia tsutsugamushi]|uniref:transposase n=1 Tax=Orientia tsutsugamushi TaxID=784 RepID=UPI0022B756CC|nr:transposase [Orientia tsutsugamushi]
MAIVIKKTLTYMEAKPEIREKYQQVISSILKENLVYIDESGIGMSICKDRWSSKKGTHVSSNKSGKYYERTNIIAGYVNNKSIAPMIFNGSCNTRLFEAWVEQLLLKELNLLSS